MNKSKLVALQLIMAFFASFNFANASNISEATIADRVETLGGGIDLQYNEHVQEKIDFYTKSQRRMTERLIGKSKIYFPLFERVLQEKNMPDGLKYLAVVESGLRPHVMSRSGAAGLWQFMKPTARMQGLKISSYVDERRDPEKSTIAAVEYLEYLHERFGDWTLAIAAYNCGPGNLNKAIRKSGGKRDFWEIRKFLPRETRNYVPKFIALNYVMNYHYEHDLSGDMQPEEMLNTSTIQAFERIDLKEMAEKLELDIDLVKALNPAYKKGIIPASESGRYTLTLPSREMYVHVTGKQPPTLKEQLALQANQEALESTRTASAVKIELQAISLVDTGLVVSSRDPQNGRLQALNQSLALLTNNRSGKKRRNYKKFVHNLKGQESTILEIAGVMQD